MGPFMFFSITVYFLCIGSLLLICFEEEKKFGDVLPQGGPLPKKYGQKLFSLNHIIMGTIWKISSNWVEISVFFKYFDPIQATNMGFLG